MDFAEQLKLLIDKIIKYKDQINTEEATKTAFIMPFFDLLGYDTRNPIEFIPEFTCDIGTKKGEKIDYAIHIDNQPTILIECKWCGENLEKHDAQLMRYFSVSQAKIGILTNGIIYKFFTDLEETNKMDSKPFLEINLLSIRDNEIVELKKESKLSNEKKKEVKNVAVWGCLIISYDCGTKGISCGETLSEIIEQALNGYDFMCSDVEP